MPEMFQNELCAAKAGPCSMAKKISETTAICGVAAKSPPRRGPRRSAAAVPRSTKPADTTIFAIRRASGAEPSDTLPTIHDPAILTGHERPQVPPAGLSRPEPGAAQAVTPSPAGRRFAARRRHARPANRFEMRGVWSGPAHRDVVARAVPELPRGHSCLPPVHPLRAEPALRVHGAHPREDHRQERPQPVRRVLAPRDGGTRRLARLDAPERHPARLRQPLQEVAGRDRASPRRVARRDGGGGRARAGADSPLTDRPPARGDRLTPRSALL